MAASARSFEFDGAGLRMVGDRWAGDGDRGVVVLLHGGGQTRHSWAHTGERLAAGGWTAIALDARGHGDSEWDPAQDYTLDAFAADLVAFAATLDTPPVLVGASLGGITALVAAGEHPELARALVLVDVVVRVEPEGVTRILAFMSANPDGFASLEEVADAVSAYNPLRRRARNLDGLRKNVRQRADGRWYWHWDPAFTRIDDEPQRHTDPQRLRAAASRLRIPTLLVRGAQSDVVSNEGLADMQRLIPYAECVEVGGAGHMVAGDDNDVFATRLETFLTHLNGGASTS
jgi:pimeloyl-ACP methyl ester carboxylesterase